MNETLPTCPVCNSAETEKYLQCKDFTVSKEIFSLVNCMSCSFIFTNPRPAENEIGKYYQSAEYVSHSDTKKGLINRLYHTVRKITLGNKLQLINRLHNNKAGKLLDVGCGTGYFISHCKENNWNVTGVEVDANARKMAEERLSPSTKAQGKLGEGEHIYSWLNDVKENEFDIITLWHVLEHVHDLNAYLEALKKLLKNSGKLIIAVPNAASFDAGHYKEYWAAYDVPRHLYHFTPDTIGRLFKKHNLKLEQTLPMKFDAYYVSMLSEKYKTGKTNYLNVLINGFRSNSKASGNGQYSSLIYVVSKA